MSGLDPKQVVFDDQYRDLLRSESMTDIQNQIHFPSDVTFAILVVMETRYAPFFQSKRTGAVSRAWRQRPRPNGNVGGTQSCHSCIASRLSQLRRTGVIACCSSEDQRFRRKWSFDDENSIGGHEGLQLRVIDFFRFLDFSLKFHLLRFARLWAVQDSVSFHHDSLCVCTNLVVGKLLKPNLLDSLTN